MATDLNRLPEISHSALRAGIFSAPQGPPLMDSAFEGRFVEVRTISVRIPRHVVRPFGVVFEKVFFHFILSKGEHISTAVSPA